MSDTASFFSRTPKITTVEQMDARLKERSAKAKEPTPASALPKAQPSALRPAVRLAWMDPVATGNGTGHQLSVGGLYSVCKVRVADALQYEAWVRVPLQMRLGRVKDAAQGRELCQTHMDNP